MKKRIKNIENESTNFTLFPFFSKLTFSNDKKLLFLSDIENLDELKPIKPHDTTSKSGLLIMNFHLCFQKLQSLNASHYCLRMMARKKYSWIHFYFFNGKIYNK